MIKYNNKTINDFYFDTSNLVKVYRNNAVCYYKISGGGDTPTSQTPCYAVVTDISQYSDTEFEDFCIAPNISVKIIMSNISLSIAMTLFLSEGTSTFIM